MPTGGNNNHNSGGLSIDLVELPRLGLSFRARTEDKEEGQEGQEGQTDTRLYSVDHEGLFVSNAATTCASTQQLLKGLPHAVVLERSDDGESFFVFGVTWCTTWCYLVYYLVLLGVLLVLLGVT